MESNEKRVRPPLGEKIGASLYATFDAGSDDSMEACFKVVEDAWGGIDFLVHAIAFAGPDQIKGSFVENATPRRLRPGSGHLLLQLRRRLAPGGSVDEERRLDHHPDLPGLGAGYPELQHHGRGQGGAGGGDTLHRSRSRPQPASGSTPSPPAPCAPYRLAGISGGRGMLAQGPQAFSALKEDTSDGGGRRLRPYGCYPTSAARPPAKWSTSTPAST